MMHSDMRTIKYLMFAALGLCLVMTSACEKNEGEPTTGNEQQLDPLGGDKRGNITGTYGVEFNCSLQSLSGVRTSARIEKSGRNNLRLSGSINVSGVIIDFSSELSGLKEFNNVDGKAATGYYFKFDEQPLQVAGSMSQFKGNGAYDDGYDGMLYKMKDGSLNFFSIEIDNRPFGGELFINIESVER
jgi:hypothetical protein